MSVKAMKSVTPGTIAIASFPDPKIRESLRMLDPDGSGTCAGGHSGSALWLGENAAPPPERPGFSIVAASLLSPALAGVLVAETSGVCGLVVEWSSRHPHPRAWNSSVRRWLHWRGGRAHPPQQVKWMLAS